MSSLFDTGGGYETFLIHEVEVRRRPDAVDRFGQAVGRNPSQLAAQDPDHTLQGRLDKGRGGYVMNERSADVYEVRHMLFVDKNADIREDDAVTVNDPATGRTLLDMGRILLKNHIYMGTEPHHIECTVSVQRGPLS